MENISAFLRACENLKVPAHDSFHTVDLFEAKNPKAVFTNLHSLGRVAQLLPGYSGPVLGATLATATARSFTELQLLEAKAAITGQRCIPADPTPPRLMSHLLWSHGMSHDMTHVTLTHATPTLVRPVQSYHRKV